MRARLIASVVGFCCLASLGCSSKVSGSKLDGAGNTAGTDSTIGGGGSSPTSGGTGGSDASSSGGTVSLIIPDSGTGDGSPDGVPSGDTCGNMCPQGLTCAPETCDGVDNNCDGIVDNVDKNGDGICDCLLIATLGLAGTWGNGDVFATWLSARSNNGAADLADQTLTPELLAKYQVIVAQDVHSNHAYTDAEAQALFAWVKAGGGFMTLIGYAETGEEANVNRLLAPFSMSYADREVLPARGNATIPITDWVAHPIDQGVTAVGVDQGCPVQGMGTVIARNGSYDMALAQEVLPGHVFMWGDEWITYDSEWQQRTDYQVELLWVNAIKWLTKVSTCQVPIPPVFPK
jgi:hypothetical protein